MSALIAIVGPTAVGKSSLAMHFAKTFDGEIVSSDSCQVYRYMDIGTAKPSQVERKLVPHHLIDVIDPDDAFNLATYQKLAYEAIDGIHSRGRPAILVGGSGLYVRSVLGGYRIPEAPPDYKLRRRLEGKAKVEGADALSGELQKVDPAAAQNIDPKNIRRVIRAIEVYRTTGQPYSELTKAEPSKYDILKIGLTIDRVKLYEMIDDRVDSMIEMGLVDEVKRLVDKGYSYDLTSMCSLGYKQIGECLRSKTTLNEAVDKIKYETHRFARHQYGWFRLKDDTIKWFDVSEEVRKRVDNLVDGFISQTN
ncbi:tRNA (adenosine(37)-N6)-dimethylallyltransferase MiaA [Chloroflexota bacterium]